MARFRRLRGCLTEIGVDQAGDRRHRWGFLYDELDYTGLDSRTALVRHRGRRSRPDLVLLDLSSARECLSRPVDPRGTGASPVVGPAPAPGTPSVPGLLTRLRRLEARARQVDIRSDRFDAWASCLSSVPVTEFGDRDQGLGYVIAADGSTSSTYVPAIDLDHTEWDDPDYQLLALDERGRGSGRTTCEGDPGEAADRQRPGTRPVLRDSAGDLELLRSGVRALGEDVGDLVGPVREFTHFDECLYTVGAQESPGYQYRRRDGTLTSRAAWSFDMRGGGLADLQLLSFPGEEAPQIECNEDAESGGGDE